MKNQKYLRNFKNSNTFSIQFKHFTLTRRHWSYAHSLAYAPTFPTFPPTCINFFHKNVFLPCFSPPKTWIIAANQWLQTSIATVFRSLLLLLHAISWALRWCWSCFLHFLKKYCVSSGILVSFQRTLFVVGRAALSLVISVDFATFFRRWKFILLYSFPYSGRPIILDNNNNNEIIVFCFRVLNIYARKIYGKVGCILKQKKTNMFKLLQLWCCWVCNYFHYYFCQLVSKKGQCRKICVRTISGKTDISLNIEKKRVLLNHFDYMIMVLKIYNFGHTKTV